MNLTHDQLVERAVRWALNSLRLGVVLAEYRCSAFIEPDVLGFGGWGNTSVLVECKCSRSDFRADRKKFIHNKDIGDDAPGLERWYFTPKGLLKPRDLPRGWGLAEVRGSRVYKVVKPKPWRKLKPDVIRRRRAAGMPFLYSFARRTAIGIRFDARRGRFQPSIAEVAK